MLTAEKSEAVRLLPKSCAMQVVLEYLDNRKTVKMRAAGKALADGQIAKVLIHLKLTKDLPRDIRDPTGFFIRHNHVNKVEVTLNKIDLDARLKILEAVTLHNGENIKALSFTVPARVIPSVRHNLMITSSIKRLTNLEELHIASTMPFLLNEIVEAARETNAFKRVRSLILWFHDAFRKRALADFMSLFDPAILTEVRVLSPYLGEVYPIMDELDFKCRILALNAPKNFAAMQRTIIKQA